MNRLRRWLTTAKEEAEEATAEEPPPASPPPTVVEWGARLLSLLFLLALAGVIIYQGTRPTVPTRLRLEADVAQSEQRGDEWALPVTVINEGSLPIREVVLTVQLMAGEAVVDEVELTVALMGPGERSQAELWFSEDPSAHEVALDVVGYQLP